MSTTRTSDSKPLKGMQVPPWLAAIGVGLGYWILGEPCEAVTLTSRSVPMLWLPSGYLVAVLLLISVRRWPSLALAILAASLLVEVGFNPLGEVSALRAIGMPAAAFATAWLLQHTLLRRVELLRYSLTWSSLAAGGVLGLLTGLLLFGVAAIAGQRNPFDLGQSWLGSTLTGSLLSFPLVLSIASVVRNDPPQGRALSWEFGAVCAGSIVLAWLLFLRDPSFANAFWPAPYLVFPLFIWAAIRAGNLGVATSLFIVGVFAAGATPSNLGPIAQLADSDSVRMLLLLSFILVAGVSAHLLASATSESRQAMLTLAATEERYRTIFERASDGIVLASADAAVIEANDAALRLTGLTREQIIGMKGSDLIDPGSVRERPLREDDVKKGVSFVHERIFLRPDGVKVPVELSVQPLPDGRVIGICRNLTDRNNFEAAIREIVAGTVTHVGEAFFQQLVKSLAGALNVRYALAAEIIDPAAKRVRTLGVWSQGAAGPTLEYDLEHTPCDNSVRNQVCFCPEGVQQQYPKDHLLQDMGAESYLGVVITGSGNQPLGLLAVLDDKRMEVIEPANSILRIFAARAGAEIERVRSEAALRQSEERQRALLAAFPDALFVMTLDGVYIDFHTQQPDRLRLPPEEFLGKSFRDVMPKELLPKFERAFETLKKGKQPKVFEYSGLVHGVPEHFEVRHTYVGQGLVLAILRNVTERKQFDAEIRRLNENLERLVEERTEQLAAANQELESFAYSVSHDLRAPLRGIHGNASILKEELGDKASPETSVLLDRIIARANEMSNLIDGLLKISRIMRAELQRSDVDLSRLAAEAYESVVRWYPRRSIEVEIEPNLAVQVDPVLLRAALTNLFDNALKFTAQQPHPRILFGSERAAAETVYFVQDNGVGFNMEYQGKLFRPFERLHGTDEFAGTGIGLATVQRIVTRHGGRVWAESTLGQGAKFFFTLGNPAAPVS